MLTSLEQSWLWRKAQEARARGLFKPAVILAVLGAAAILGRHASFQMVILLLAAIVGLTLFTVLTRHLDWGILLLLPISFSVRYAIGTGTQTSINMTIIWIALMLAAWVTRMFVLERRVRLLPTRVNLPAVLFMLAVSLSLVAGSIRWVPLALGGASTFAQLGGWMLYVFPVALMLMVGNVFLTRRGLRILMGLFMVLGLAYLLANLFGLRTVLRLFFTTSGQTSVFYTWLAALAFGQFLFNQDLKGGRRFLFGLLAVFSIGVMFAQLRTWVSGWLPPVLALGALIWLRSWRWGVLMTLAAPVAVYLFAPEMINQILVGDNEYSVVTRLATWPIMYELVKASPILGLGPSNYYHYTPVYYIMGYQVKFNSHNNYWDIAAQTGLLGLGLFLWMVFELGRLGWRMRGQAQDGFERGFINGALGGMAATLAAGMLADWFMPFVYNIGFQGFRSAVYAWLFMGGLLGLEQIWRRGGEADLEGESR